MFIDPSSSSVSLGKAELVSENDRVADFVKLQATPMRRAVDKGVLRKGAVGLLLEIKEVVQGASRPGQIPVGDKRRYNFVQIAGPHRVVDGGGVIQAG